jgi:hypothetical protein
MSVSVPTWTTSQTGLVQPAPVVTVAGALCGEALAWASRATTSYTYRRAGARPLSMNEVAGGSVGVPATVPALAPSR